MAKWVSEYVATCHGCLRSKSRRHKPYGTLKSIELPTLPWAAISMDFIEGLPMSKGYNAILVVVDRMTKSAKFIPCDNKMSVPKLADVYLEHVFSKHGLPDSIVSDRGSEFASEFWREFTDRLKVKTDLSTAYHPQTDGATERINQTIEHYLRSYINYNQDDWREWLPLAEFSYNNSYHDAIKDTPFHALYGYHPRFDMEESFSEMQSVLAKKRIEDFEGFRAEIREVLKDSLERSRRYFDQDHLEAPPYKVGDKVWLNTRNIKTKRPMKKLDVRWIGPLKVLEKISTHAFRLELPKGLSRIHNVFHVDLIEPSKPSEIGDRNQEPGPVIEEASDDGYEVDAILDSRRRKGKFEYRVHWAGYHGDDAFQWITLDMCLNISEVVDTFHLKYPEKPVPTEDEWLAAKLV